MEWQVVTKENQPHTGKRYVLLYRGGGTKARTVNKLPVFKGVVAFLELPEPPESLVRTEGKLYFDRLMDSLEHYEALNDDHNFKSDLIDDIEYAQRYLRKLKRSLAE